MNQPHPLAIALEHLARDGRQAEASGNPLLVRLIGEFHAAVRSMKPGEPVRPEILERLGKARAFTIARLQQPGGPPPALPPSVERTFAMLKGRPDASGVRPDPRREASGVGVDPRRRPDLSGVGMDPRRAPDLSGVGVDPRRAPDLSGVGVDPRRAPDLSGVGMDPRRGPELSGARMDPRRELSSAKMDPRREVSTARPDPRREVSTARMDPRRGPDISGVGMDPRREVSAARMDPRRAASALLGDGFGQSEEITASSAPVGELSPMERAALARMPPPERAFYTGLDKRFQSFYLRFPPPQRAYFRTLAPADRSAYLAMTPEEQTFLHALTPNERLTYLALAQPQRDAVRSMGDAGRQRLRGAPAEPGKSANALSAEIAEDLLVVLGDARTNARESSPRREKVLRIAYNFLVETSNHLAFARTRTLQTMLSMTDYTELFLTRFEEDLVRAVAAKKDAKPGTDYVAWFKRNRTAMVEHALKQVHPELATGELFEALRAIVFAGAEKQPSGVVRRRGGGNKPNEKLKGRYIPG